jgi:16S rRNA (guanine527-N7)-methyltransferase
MPAAAWFAEILERKLRPWLTLNQNQMARLYEHYQLLERWNKRINLTSIASGEEMVVRHYCESLFFAAQLSNDADSLVDIGSGAGFPGFPIAIAKPHWAITLVESNQRKAVFLRETARGVANISVISRRAEEISGTFDWLVSRAVNLGDVLALVPRLAPKIGLLLGEDDYQSLKSAKHIAWCEPIRLPWGDRSICVVGECFT